MTPDQLPCLQHHAIACRVGDWVLSSSVPEWTADRVEQIFTPPNRVLGAALDDPKDWTFRGSYYIDAAGDAVPIWRREA